MIDAISLKILKILQKKARIPNVEVARQVGMAPSAVLERIRKLEKQGFIDGYEVRLNPKRFAKSLVAFVTVKLHIPEVQEVHYVAGEDAFLVKIRAADPEALSCLTRDKIASIAAVQSTQTAIAMSTYKETARIPIEKVD
jgi:Lrp/AsnC family leucine-responsive transcriptional regulator